MRRQVVTKLGIVLGVLFVIALSAPRAVKGQNFTRLVSEFQNSGETSTLATGTANAGGGTIQYTKPVFFPAGATTAYVTISATADTHNGAAEWLACTVDALGGNPGDSCLGGATGFGADEAPSGWTALSKHFNYNTACGPATGATCWNGNKTVTGDGGLFGGAGDMHDNSIYYTWCTPITPGVHVIRVKQASSKAGFPNEVFWEKAHFYIDSSDSTGPTCQAATGAL